MSHDHPKILLVEDEPDVSAVVQSYFGRRGFSVSTTGSGSEALLMIKALKPQLVLLDISLLELNGVEVLKQLREYDKDTKVVIITGQMHSAEDIDEIVALGVSGYRNKPLVLEEIEKLVYEVVGNKPLPKITEKANNLPKQVGDSNRKFVHDLSNLLGIIRNKCENFTLNIEDGIYKNKSQKELVQMSVEIMKDIEKTVDRAVDVVDKIPKPTKQKKK